MLADVNMASKAKFTLNGPNNYPMYSTNEKPVVTITNTMNTIFSTVVIRVIALMMSFDSRKNEHEIHKL
jgi:hypothetical protein